MACVYVACSQFAMVETVLTALNDASVLPSLSKPQKAAVVCAGMCAIGLLFVTRGGLHWLELFDAFSCNVTRTAHRLQPSTAASSLLASQETQRPWAAASSLPASLVILRRSGPLWCGQVTLFLAGALECIAVGWVYGGERFAADTLRMTKTHLPRPLLWNIQYVIPCILFVLTLYTLVSSISGGYAFPPAGNTTQSRRLKRPWTRLRLASSLAHPVL